ncbi:MAG: phenylalanine--tRNA ligase subunit alpha [Thaumarchaeota archaeon]|nr:phenylalanine--tRNA ligase subunit alpha [Nitrososphaerota archaeon]
MSKVFHEIEKKIILLLDENPKLTPKKIGTSTGLTPDQIRRGIEWLKFKKLVIVEESQQVYLRLGKNGLGANSKGLPERQLMDLLKEKPRKLNELKQELKSIFSPAMGIARKNNWIETDGENISLKNPPSDILEEKIISKIGKNKILVSEIEDKKTLEFLKKRPNFIIEEIEKSQIISLSEKGKSISETVKISEDVVVKAIDVEADVPKTFVAKTHPLKDIINEIREIFVTLGFTEILGKLAQPCFWNFDALFTPQDHPARELQDTFYLDGVNSKKIATPKQIQQVAKVHKNSWRYLWSINKARQMVLRTHTTCDTIKFLADHKPDEARVFSLGRVFRNEKVSYKHLVEFNQVEGIVVGKNTTLRDLMGIQREFFHRMGLNKIKFWPTYFPYTEPSLQSMVYNERLDKWVELFGMGIFRPEVTKPLGITKPVLAWGGGIERIAMLKYGLDDVREFYSNNLKWLRSVTKCQ